MTKIALITDQHFGARNDSIIFLDHYEKFYKETFFPTLQKENIKEVYILGDTFDRRKYINFYTLHRTKEMFISKLDRHHKATIIVGNHDTYFKNTNSVNSVDLVTGVWGEFDIIERPTTIGDFCFIPWICDDNYEDTMKELSDTHATFCAGHLEVEGFAMYKGDKSEGGLSRKLFQKFDMTFSGHYHHKSDADGIYYLGNPYQLTWQDYGDKRGFHILDTDTRKLTFIQNPNDIFIKLIYDDKQNVSVLNVENNDVVYMMKDTDELVSIVPNFYHNKYVKIVVVNKKNPYGFEQFMTKLYKTNPADVTIVEDFTDIISTEYDQIIDQAEDTLSILNTYVDSIEKESLDPNELKKILKQVYVEAINIEAV